MSRWFYHILAFFYGRTHWNPFRESLANWMSSWNPNTQNLILIGPSGGYCLSKAFLQQFQKITVIEPDPLARMIFKMRMKSLNVSLEFQAKSLDPHLPIEKTLRSLDSSASILFCNVLGQLPFYQSLEDNWAQKLSRSMKDRSFLSFHDRYSGQKPVKLSSDGTHFTLETGEYVDHLTSELFKGYQKQYFLWRISPHRFHLIEACHSDHPSDNLETSDHSDEEANQMPPQISGSS